MNESDIKVWRCGEMVRIEREVEDMVTDRIELTVNQILGIADELCPSPPPEAPRDVEEEPVSWRQELPRLVAMGVSTKFIAEKFGISTATVSKERQRQGLTTRKWTDEQRARFRETRWPTNQAAE